MNYHDIQKCNMLNGEGLRVVLFVSGCSHACDECQNPETWPVDSGIPFDKKAREEIFTELEKEYISGLTLSGGDPMNEHNLGDILYLLKETRIRYPEKDIWIYTGYTYEQLQNDKSQHGDMRRKILTYCDYLVDGRFEKDKADVSYPWAGSTNQRVINLKESLKTGEVVLKETE